MSTDCRECKHSIMHYKQLQCTAGQFSRPVEYMRDARSDCGPEAMLFEDRKEVKYALYDDL